MKELLHPSALHEYQRECVVHQLTHDFTMLWLQMGLGKTIISLTTIIDRMRAGQIKKVIIFGPLRVVTSVWFREALKWSHTKDLRFSILHGDKDKRTRALFAEADIFLCNYENMNWLAETLMHYYISQNRPVPFEMVIYDEVSKVKNATSRRMAGGIRKIEDDFGNSYEIDITGWRALIPYFKYRMGLTGTPASNGYLDLFGQFLAVDGGERFGESVTHFKESYFVKDYNGWSCTVTDQGKELIEGKIFDITKKMDVRDYLDLPPVRTTNIIVDLPSRVRKAYEELEKKMFTELESGTEIELFNKATLSNKCLQFCNGSVYTDPLVRTEYEKLHDVKLKALEDIIEEAGGSPVLCSYSFKSDAERIMQHFKSIKPVNLSTAPVNQTDKIIDNWNSGKVKLLIGHPASMAHGIDGLQQSGSIVVWFGVNWSLELYEQMNGRIDRQGQTSPVSIIRILCGSTVDIAVADAIQRKTDDQDGLKAAIDRYRKGITTNELEINFF